MILNTDGLHGVTDKCELITWHEESKTNSMLHNGLLKLMIRSTYFGHYYANRQELATIQMAPACDTSPWLWQVAGLLHGCRFERPGRGMLHDPNVQTCSHASDQQPAITKVRCHTLGPSV